MALICVKLSFAASLGLAKQTGLAALVAVAVVALYGSGLSGGFFFDDDVNIVYVEALKLSRLDLDNLRAAWQSGRSGPLGRPIAQVSFALNHYFNGFDPYFFKITNLVIHLMTGILVFLAARCLRFSLLLAGFVMAFFLLHPVQLTSVLYVVQRMTSLAALFLLAAFLLHVVGRERGARAGWAMLLAAWCVCWPLSMLSKETGTLFPLFVVGWEVIVRRQQIGQLDRFGKIVSATVALAVAAGGVYLLLPADEWLWAGYAMRDFSPLERLLTESRVIWLYLGLIFLPRLDAFGLQHDDIVLSTGWLTPWTTLVSLFGLALLMGMAWVARKKYPLASFGIVWFLIGHSLEATFLPLEIAHEHRNYLPLFGVLLAMASVLQPLTRQAGWQKTLVLGGVAAALGYSALLTGLRAHQFGDVLRRTQLEAMHHPNSSRAHYEAGRALAAYARQAPPNDPSRFFTASHYEQATELNRNAKLPLLGLIHLNCLAALPIKPEWLDELKRRLRHTPFAPGDRTVLYSVKEMSVASTLCLAHDEVIELFSAALANASTNAHSRMLMHSWRADYLTVVARDLPVAEIELDRALAISPHNPSNRLKRAQLDFLQGRYVEAARRLDGLRDATLVGSERKTMAQLRVCLASDNPAAMCAGI